jgi:2-polyprenyl-3-methyl-5-hydroxy-6-metoxy-1,4-benzoquinol methylase
VPENPSEIYNEAYFKNEKQDSGFGYVDYDQDKESMRGNFDQYMKRLEGITPERDIFDIGAATGFFLDIARQRGWKTSGSEVSKYATEVASNRGHRIFSGPITDMKIDDKYGVITMWDVLEHLDNPLEYMKS